MPRWAIAVYLIYAKRRVDCPRRGVTVEQVPWAEGKHHLTRAYAVFLARWARRLSWREVSLIFRTSWENVYRSVAWMVEYGLQNRGLDDITAIGVDEVQFRTGHKYLTVVYQIDSSCRRLLAPEWPCWPWSCCGASRWWWTWCWLYWRCSLAAGPRRIRRGKTRLASSQMQRTSRARCT